MSPPARAADWWRTAVIYEIYPRSFQDADGDGVGDLAGITRRLDYLADLGVDAIWLTPIYPSPQKDFGYDVADFTSIDPRYGTLADFDRLVLEAARRGIRVIMDLVLNHTSDEHPWFVESRSSRDNARHDWYVWHDGRPRADGTIAPPNNWINWTAQPAWQWDQTRRQFYYHYFEVGQPDLNWRNPAVAEAMFDVARFWAARGVAGFRLDALATLFEDPTLADAPPGDGVDEYGEPTTSMVGQRNRPEVHEALRALRRATDALPIPPVLIGEVYTQETAALVPFYGTPEAPQVHLPMNSNVGFVNRLDAAAFRRRLQEAETAFADWTPLNVTDNHDRPRSWDRYGDGVHDAAIARIIATVLLASRGAAFVYQGQEIGMVTTRPARREDVRDPRGLVGWPDDLGRDGERTPMQWDDTPGAGFTKGRPWLPIPASAATTNVAQQQDDPASLLAWYRALIALRRARPTVLGTGRTTLFDHDAAGVLAWLRRDEDGAGPAVLVACNMTGQALTLDAAADLRASGVEAARLTPLLASEGATTTGLAVLLPPYATLVADLSR